MPLCVHMYASVCTCGEQLSGVPAVGSSGTNSGHQAWQDKLPFFLKKKTNKHINHLNSLQSLSFNYP